MNEAKKARSDAATSKRADETGLERSAVPCSHVDFTTRLRTCQGWIAGALGIGRDQTRTGRELAQMLGLSDLRAITAEIERERRDGCPICAATGTAPGYYLAGSADDLRAYLCSLDHRLRMLTATRAHLGETLARMEGQQTMEGW